MTYKDHFSRFLGADPERLHFAAHSHHYWPDVTFEAHQKAWLDAAASADDKWGPLLGELLPRVQAHVARTLSLTRPADIAFAPNTHDFVYRLFSCFPSSRPVRIVTSDGEFHSFARQTTRWEEEGLATVVRVPLEPFATYPERLQAEVASGEHDLLFVSQVNFNCGYVIEDLQGLVESAPDETMVVIDGYHGFMALPTDLSAVQDRAFYLAGGYKYAMSGEGCCFMVCPPGYGERPVDTGWFAAFGELEAGAADADVPYSRDGYRFMGATFDPSALYRLHAVMELLQREGITVEAIHAHVRRLQEAFLEGLPELGHASVNAGSLIPGRGQGERGHFLTFRTDEAGTIHGRLKERGVMTDYRGDRLRFGFALYHDQADVDELLARLR